MLREEAIEVIKQDIPCEHDTDLIEALDMAIKSLEQEQKTGHWVRWYEIIEKKYCTIHEPHCKCSECGQEYDPYIASSFNYCPNCGARMFEKRESEEV